MTIPPSVALKTILLVALQPGVFAQQATTAEPQKPERTVREIMRSLRENAEPGEPHQRLERVIGRWRTEGLFWLSPESKPIEFKGRSESQWILGSRFVRTTFETDLDILGYDNEGVFLEGYDNSIGKYVVSTIETYSTSITRLEGSCADDCRRMEWRAQVLEPSTRQEVQVRVVRTFFKASRYRLEVFFQAPGRDEFLQTRLNAKRIPN